jgi:hypothetical protein
MLLGMKLKQRWEMKHIVISLILCLGLLSGCASVVKTTENAKVTPDTSATEKSRHYDFMCNNTLKKAVVYKKLKGPDYEVYFITGPCTWV